MTNLSAVKSRENLIKRKHFIVIDNKSEASTRVLLNLLASCECDHNGG